MWRYNLSKSQIEKAKKFIAGKNKTQPNFMKKYKGTVKNGKLFLDNRQVIPKDQQDDYIRKKVLGGRVPMTRDGLYYFLSKITVGISRASIDKFLKAQHIIRETDNIQPSTKKASRKVNKKGQIEFDLVEINWRDLGFTPTIDWKALNIEPTAEQRQSGYIFTVADALTGLLFAKFSPTKTHQHITPIAKEGFAWLSEKMDTPLSKMHGLSDKGDEFNFKLYKKWGLRTKQVARAPLIEQKNSQFQRALYRVAKMKNTKSIHKLVKDSMMIVNRTQSSLTKVAPIEASSAPPEELAKKYNKRRGKDSGTKIKARPLKIGEFVRLMILKDKDKSNYTFHKAYKGKSYSKQRYKILAKRRNYYKIDGPDGKKFYHREKLRVTPPPDRKTIKLLYEREKAAEKKDKIDTAKIRKDIDENVGGRRRSSRAGAKKAKEKFRAMVDREKRRDKQIGS